MESSRVIHEQREGQPEWMDGSGGRVICWNERGHKHIKLTHLLLHSDYLGDPWFWHSSKSDGDDHVGALEIITSHVRGVHE